MPDVLVFAAAATTHPGRRFRQNQDAVALGDEVWANAGVRTQTARDDLLVAVADGSAMAPCASRASRMVLELLVDEARRGAGLSPAVARALQRQIADRATGTPCEGMASTVAAIRFVAGIAHVLAVGDSRVYLLRDGRLRQVSVDHTVRHRMLRDGDLTPLEAEQAGSLYDDLDSAIVASGFEDEFDVFHTQEVCRIGDLWLCCSDGLTAALPDAVLLEILESHSSAPKRQAETLVAYATAQPQCDDNVSAIVVAVERTGETRNR